MTMACLPVRALEATIAPQQSRTPVAWFTSDDIGTAPADIWVDHHRTAHERAQARRGRTLCDVRVIGGNAPTHAQVSVVGCRNCAARRAAPTQLTAVV
ncbi:hypothetical protein BJ970_007650 [Saccharopolyspora phatthalungensis]|uniref:Uncharacterized protein n=1 Tax=Saccharopolyspora phatthalungensis TaxID=664693 RepID=A0A840QKI6_9PSEU|nr:hypothetical protein [Saccharopolyspora phatthalungensis]